MRSHSEVRIRRSEAERRRLLGRFEASKLSAAAFCEKESLSLSSLQRWRNELRRATNAASFVELPIPTLSNASSTWSAEVELPNGVVLRFRG